MNQGNAMFKQPNQASAMMPFLLAALLAGCATREPQRESGASGVLAQRLDDLERRMQRLEGRPPLEAPYRNRADIQAHIKQLEADRARLLVKYTDQHPAVRDIDRKLLILREQLGMMRE